MPSGSVSRQVHRNIYSVLSVSVRRAIFFFSTRDPQSALSNQRLCNTLPIFIHEDLSPTVRALIYLGPPCGVCLVRSLVDR